MYYNVCVVYKTSDDYKFLDTPKKWCKQQGINYEIYCVHGKDMWMFDTSTDAENFDYMNFKQLEN